MKTIFDHIDFLKEKPHHVRRKVAVVVAAGTSGTVALVWLVGSLASGSFAVPNTSFADIGNQTPTAVPTYQSNTGLAGAAAAVSDAQSPAHIEIVDTGSSATNTEPEQTTIPF